MKLKTLFFNVTVLRKDITRFAPLWGLYTIFQLLFVLLALGGEDAATQFMNDAPYLLQSMGTLNFFYAGICAVTIFSDLFQARMCNALHAMPMRREGWFLTHFTAGMLMCIGPNLMGALLAAFLLQQYCYGAFLWLAVMILQFLFFFGIGVFCVMCAGNRLGAVSMYLLTNLLAVLVTWLVTAFYEPVLYGIQLDSEAFTSLSPVVGFTNSSYFEISYDKITGITFEGFLPENWRYLFIAAGVGILLLVLALFIYRKRQLETAGDFISAKPAAPAFLLLYTLCAGAVLQSIAVVFSGAQYFFMVIGFAIGFFTGKMLLERKVNVFRKKNFAAFGVFVLCFFFSIALAWMDPIGITRYVPPTESVKNVQISPRENRYYVQPEFITLTNEQYIANITQLHRDLIENRTEYTYSSVPLYLCYTMKNGTTVERTYYIPEDSQHLNTLGSYYSSMEYILGTGDTQEFLGRLCGLEVYPNLAECPTIAIGVSENWIDLEKLPDSDAANIRYNLNGSFVADELTLGLFEAIEKDCREGNMVQLWEYHRGTSHFGNISLVYQGADREIEHVGIIIYADCTHTVAYLKSLTGE